MPPPPSRCYAYPLHGQTPEQQDRDRYECSTWATQQTGFDPSAPGRAAARARAWSSRRPPPGTGTAIGAVTGAILGAAIARPWQAAPAALAGAVVGGAIGNAADAGQRAADAHRAGAGPRAMAIQQQQAANYRRAIGACLDARGYSVKMSAP